MASTKPRKRQRVQTPDTIPEVVTKSNGFWFLTNISGDSQNKTVIKIFKNKTNTFPKLSPISYTE